MAEKINPQTIVEDTDPANKNVYPQNFQGVPSLSGKTTVNLTVNNIDQTVNNTFNYPAGQEYQVQFKCNSKFSGDQGLTYNPSSCTLNTCNLQVTGISNLGNIPCLRIGGGNPGDLLAKLDNDNNVVWCTPMSLAGPSGFSGAPGITGAPGSSGFSGAPGAAASSGFSGAPGAAGSSGFSGAEGAAGGSGFSGAPGAGGESGFSGFPGAAGASGFSGAEGAAGGSGFSGAPGAAGSSGFSGAPGAAGASGFSGLEGIGGVSGFSGQAGHSGFSGFAGASGFSGTAGANGLNGDKYQTTSSTSNTVDNGSKTFFIDTGLAYSISQEIKIAYDISNYMDGTVTSYDVGTGQLDVLVTASYGSGTYTSWAINLAGAVGTTGTSGFSGQQGISGYSGDQGSSGFSGETGNTGISGFSGAPGAAGGSGFSGAPGAAGESGFSGFPGAAGASGFSGAPGAAGSSGFSGAAGPGGSSGFSGAEGAAGASGFSGAPGAAGESGFSGFPGAAGESGFSGFPGAAGSSGFSGFTGPAGTSGYSGEQGTSGFSGIEGLSGFSGIEGLSGFSGIEGISGFSGQTGPEGTSGYSGEPGTVGPEGISGFSGYSGVGGIGLPTGGTTGQALVKVSSTNYDTTWATVGGGGGSPGGSNTQVQYNDSGSFTGATGLTYDNATCSVGLSKIDVFNDQTLDVTVTVTGVPSWSSTFGDQDLTNDMEWFNSSAYDSAGHLYAIGSNLSDIPFLVKYDTDGSILWQKQFDDSDTKYYRDGVTVTVDNSDNIYCIVNDGNPTTSTNVFKLTSAGAIVWQTKLVGNVISNEYEGSDITFDSAGNIIITARDYMATPNGNLVVKIDSTGGSILWQKGITLQNEDFFMSVAVDSSDNIYVFAEDYALPSYAYHALIIKFDNSGTVQWANNYTYSTWDMYHGAMVIDASNNIYITGLGYDTTVNNDEYIYVAKLDTTGAVIWQTNFAAPNASYDLYGIDYDSSGNIYVNTSYDDPNSPYNSLIWSAKLNNAGAVQWQRFFEKNNGDIYSSYNIYGRSLAVNNNVYAMNAYVNYNDPATGWTDEALAVQLPTDGSLTGVYTNYTYKTASLTTDNNMASGTANTDTIYTGDLTIISSTYSLSNSAYYNNLEVYFNPGSSTYTFDKNYLSLTSNSACSLVLKTGTCERLSVSNSGLLINGAQYSPSLDSKCNFIVQDGVTTLSPNICSNVNIGKYSQHCNSCGTYNIAIGDKTLCKNVNGNENIAIGINAMANACNVNSQIAIGPYTLANLACTGGYYGGNIAMGGIALSNLTSGQANIAIGPSSAQYTCSGSFNVAVGGLSMYLQTEGVNNTVLGFCALPGIGCGTICDNVAVGFKAGGTGSYSVANIAIGKYAGSTMSGEGNVSIGMFSGHGGVGNYSIAIGHCAGLNASNCQRQSNISIGAFTGPGNNAYRCACDNVLIGRCAGSCVLGDNNIAIGYGSLRIPTLGNYGCGSNNIAIGVNSLCNMYCTNAGSNIAIGSYAGTSICRGRCNTLLGFCTGASLINNCNNIIIGWCADTPAVDNTITLGNSSIACIRSAVTTISALSDMRDKTDIEDIPLGLDFVKELHPVKFTWNMRDGGKIGIQDSGFIAQEVAALEEKYGAENWLDMVGRADSEKLELKPAKLIPIMVKAIQDLINQNKALEERIKVLENKT